VPRKLVIALVFLSVFFSFSGYPESYRSPCESALQTAVPGWEDFGEVFLPGLTVDMSVSALDCLVPKVLSGKSDEDLLDLIASYRADDNLELELYALEQLVFRTGEMDYWLDLLDALLAHTADGYQQYLTLKLKEPLNKSKISLA